MEENILQPVVINPWDLISSKLNTENPLHNQSKELTNLQVTELIIEYHNLMSKHQRDEIELLSNRLKGFKEHYLIDENKQIFIDTKLERDNLKNRLDKALIIIPIIIERLREKELPEPVEELEGLLSLISDEDVSDEDISDLYNEDNDDHSASVTGLTNEEINNLPF